MTVKNQLKVLDNRIRQNQADYDLYRKNAKISPLSSGKIDKYEYLTGEDLGYRSYPVQKGKFEYSPLGQVFKKGLEKNEKDVGLLKRLKNVEDKTDSQLDLIRDQDDRQIQATKDQKYNQSVLKSIGYSIRNKLLEDAVKVFDYLLKKDKSINYKRLSKEFAGDDHDFTMFLTMGELLKQLYF